MKPRTLWIASAARALGRVVEYAGGGPHDHDVQLGNGLHASFASSLVARGISKYAPATCSPNPGSDALVGLTGISDTGITGAGGTANQLLQTAYIGVTAHTSASRVRPGQTFPVAAASTERQVF